MGTCRVCGSSGVTISDAIGVCVGCLRGKDEELTSKYFKVSHHNYRKRLGLPEEPPRGEGITCPICVNNCTIPEGGKGFCGYWRNSGGRLEPVVGRDRAVVHWYLDGHPTNCVAGPVCPANTSRGYPEFTRSRGVEFGYYNLAVFFAGCSLDCIFCQNWEHKDMIVSPLQRRLHTRGVEDLIAEARNPKVTCVCYFGGDPTPHSLYALKVSEAIVEEARKRGEIKRICWETNGLENPAIMRKMARLSLASGGIVKIDWKAWTPAVYSALTGINGRKAVERVKENVKLVAELGKSREEPPLLVVSVLLVPGYVDEFEVRMIARYLASIDERTPLVLLAFYPNHLLRDLPTTSRNHAKKAREVAREEGLKEIYIGNEWLLSYAY